ncbi:hypothetical protein BH11PAT2_BH11PAT2_00290 [soil metagenome]
MFQTASERFDDVAKVWARDTLLLKQSTDQRADEKNGD